MTTYAKFVIQNRIAVILSIIVLTFLLASQISRLQVVIDPQTMLPQQHPYVRTTNYIEQNFASKNLLLVGITPSTGNIYQTEVLSTIVSLTKTLTEHTSIPICRIISLSQGAKNIASTQEGIQVKAFLPPIPESQKDLDTLKFAIESNSAYESVIVSGDGTTAAILIELRDPPYGYRPIVEEVERIIAAHLHPSLEILLGGWPIYGAALERYSERLFWLFPIAVLIVGLIHYEAFHTVQAMVLPLVTALLAVVWSLGLMGLLRVPLDTFNAATPILILAVAAGHAVQILKRYYEEYRLPLSVTHGLLAQANQTAVIAALEKVGPVMLAAGLSASIAFFSLLTFDLAVIRTFGLLTGLGILSALILELTFIPAVRTLLPPPKDRERFRESERRIWDLVIDGITKAIKDSGWRVFAGFGAVVAVCLIGAWHLKVDDTPRSYFSQALPFQQADRLLNHRVAGTRTLHVLIQGTSEDEIKKPEVLRLMEGIQTHLASQPDVGKTLSIVDFIKRMNEAMHNDRQYHVIPADQDLIAQYLLLYSFSGSAEDFDRYVDYPYRAGAIWVFVKNDSSAFIEELIARTRDLLLTHGMSEIKVAFGGDAVSNLALHDVIVKGKLLNVVQIAAVILVITATLFRSIIAGLLVLVPIVVSIIINFGIMGWFGIPLNTPTAVISAMSVGIGADYAIYLLYRLREEYMVCQDANRAIERTLATAGKAILFVASAIAGGYGVLVFSWNFYVHVWFGSLIALAMLTSAISTILLLPYILIGLKPTFVFPRTPLN